MSILHLGFLPNSFSISVCVFVPRFVYGLLKILIHYLRIYCNCYTAGKPIHLQIFILASFVVLLFVYRRIFRVKIERIIFCSLCCSSLPLNNLHSTKTLCPYEISNMPSSAQSNELIEPGDSRSWESPKEADIV